LDETVADADLEDAGGLRQGGSIGRYVVLRRLEGGGMGIVYAAYDPQLDRRVAVKVLRASHREREATSVGRARLLREAQALARLSHPHVVSVHDVGTHDGSVFIAMEFVEGDTLAHWIRARPRPWRAALRVLLEAGDGLQAAHEAGIVHRDFKPENVMVDSAGHARVLDFGLARTDDNVAPATASPPGVPALVQLATSSPITVAGALVGTPAYMAPEQFAGVECDARTDQFAFCVTAWRALYGQRPFEGDNAFALSAAVLEGQVVLPADERSVPSFVRRVLLRGLSARREDRFESMAQLLAQLRHDPRTRRRRWTLGAGAGAVAITSVMFASRSDGVCDDGWARLAGVWDEPARREIAARFGRVPQFGAAAWQRVEVNVQTYATEWVAGYTDACAATRRHETQSEAALDLRMSCLDERSRALGALVDLLRVADLETVEASLDAVATLAPVDVCRDLEQLRQRVRPPRDPAVAEQVTQIRGELTRLGALSAAGKDVEARASIAPLREQAEATGYEPVIAEVLARAGQLEAELGDAAAAAQLQREAFFRARGSGHDDLARSVAIALVHTLGTKVFDLDAAIDWAAHARAELSRTPAVGAEVALEVNLAGAYRFAGKYGESMPHAERALALSGDSEGRRAQALTGLAAALAESGRRQEARPLYEEVLQLKERMYGPNHPRTAQSAHNFASALAVWDQPKEARPYAELAVDVWRRSRPDSPSLAMGLTTLGLIHIRAGDVDDGLATLSEAQTLVERLEGPRHPSVGKIHGNIGLALHDKGDARGAVDHFTLARDIFAEANGPAHPLVGMAESNLGLAYATLGEVEPAVAHYERALELLDPAFGADDARLRPTVEALAELERGRDRPERAAQWQARADGMRTDDGPD
jgi:serine/threonine protein kinase/Flp pilus assembly protein TadD